MTGMAEWLKNWREIVGEMRSGKYVSVTSVIDKRSYEVIRVSLYDETIDSSKKFVTTSASAFEDKTALYSHLTRDTGVIRVITTKGRNWFVVEPGADVLEWLTAVEGVSLPSLRRALRMGQLWRGIAKRAQKEKRLRRLAEAEVEELTARLDEVRLELSQIEIELAQAKVQLSQTARS